MYMSEIRFQVLAAIYPRFTHESGTIRKKQAIDVSKLKRLLCYESQHQSQRNEKSLVQFDYEKAVSNYLGTQSTFNPRYPMHPHQTLTRISRYHWSHVCECACAILCRRNRLAWPHRRRGLASDGARYAGARSRVGRRFRSVTKLTTKVRIGRGYLWGSFLIAAAALKTPTRNGYNAQGVNLNFDRLDFLCFSL